MLNTQPYGGGLWHTWFDRDLGIAGCVIVKSLDGSIESRLVRIDKPIARIPTLAIHLTAGTEREHFSPNLQEHAKALLTMEKGFVNLKNDSKTNTRFHPYLLQLVAKSINVEVDSIIDMELQLFDIQPSLVGGAECEEYILSGRLDNLCSAYQR
jgi:aspartyl aminopeptidase